MSAETTAFRVRFVDGVTVSKWARIWGERVPGIAIELVRVEDSMQVAALREGLADVAFVRLPIEAGAGLDVIPLYTEVAFVVVAKDHPVALFDSVTLDDLVGENRIDGSDDDAIALAAAGAGIVIVPQSIARLRGRRDVVSRPVTDAPASRVALVWAAGDPSERVEEFIGIVRGRTARSSRGAAADRQAVERPAKKGTPKTTPRRAAPVGARTRRSRGRPRPGQR